MELWLINDEDDLITFGIRPGLGRAFRWAADGRNVVPASWQVMPSSKNTLETFQEESFAEEH